jgi:NAD+ synthase (glutamine-hydrolysing)
LSNDLEILPSPMQEIANAPALWLWDYLRRSGARGYFLPLSGGADSASVSAIVASMAKILLKSI